MAVSIDDVAKEAGVSRGTVSHVLNGNGEARISKATQERIRLVVERLGYQPNRMARSLGRRKTDTIGLIMYGLLNPFYFHLQEAIESVGREHNYHVFSDTSTPLPAPDRQQAKLRGWPMDGVIMWANPSQTISDYFGQHSAGMNVVYLSGQPRIGTDNAVYFDVYGGAKAAMAHLIERGHRRITYVFPFDWVEQQEDEPRRCAYNDMCRIHALEPRMVLMDRHAESRRAGMEAGIKIAETPRSERPTALLCFNDIVAEGILFGLRRSGIRVPDDIALVGFDGIEEGQYLDTPLTTVRLPADIMAREALRILITQIKDKENGSSDAVKETFGQIAIETELVVGKTT